ncbi:hypothetical protein [Herminiimonas sp. CN]|uniref:hypothetical protein n=1 Tax=Herminiimonas sp. CN TaxID=1349818 RepID=UPI000473125E|nr:hypothetical protein [Herminiimonas sp. CN]
MSDAVYLVSQDGGDWSSGNPPSTPELVAASNGFVSALRGGEILFCPAYGVLTPDGTGLVESDYDPLPDINDAIIAFGGGRFCMIGITRDTDVVICISGFPDSGGAFFWTDYKLCTENASGK